MWKEIVDGYYQNGLAGYIKQQNEKFKRYSK